MNTKIIIAGALAIVALFAVVWWRSPAVSSASTTQVDQVKHSQLSAGSVFYDFGTISMAKGRVRTQFTVTNSTEGDIALPSLTTSCMCTAAYFIKSDGNKKGPFGMPGMGYVPKLNETIKPGESRIVEVEYDPAAHGPAGVGPIDRFAYLDDAMGGRISFEIKAVVTP